MLMFLGVTTDDVVGFLLSFVDVEPLEVLFLAGDRLGLGQAVGLSFGGTPYWLGLGKMVGLSFGGRFHLSLGVLLDGW